LLRTLDAKVTIRPTWSKEDRAERRMTPFWTRLTVTQGELILWNGAEEVHERLRHADHSETETNVKVSIFSADWVRPTWAHHVD
jgi:hypothetical protein